MASRLEIYTLGGVRILRDGQPLSGLTTRKTEALLIYPDFLLPQKPSANSSARLSVHVTSLSTIRFAAA
jgi:hypothetical protein